MSTVPPIQMPPPPPPPVAPPQPIPNHLAWSIIATVLALCLCCPALATGVVAIVFASKVNTLLNLGDVEGARRASANAKTWCWVTTILAIIGLGINIIFVAMGGLNSYMEYVQQLQQMS